MMQPLVCPQCGTTIPAEHINISELVAVCPNCSTVFNFSSANQALEKAKHKNLPMPTRVSVVEKDDQTIISVSWRRWGRLIYMIPFTLFWLIALFSWIQPAIQGKDLDSLVFILPHTLIGVYLAYQLLTLLFMKTQIVLDNQAVSVSVKPNLFARCNVLHYDEIVKLCYKQRLPSFLDSRGIALRGINDLTPEYVLHAVLMNNNERLLMRSDDEHIIRYVGQRIKDAIQLPDDLEKIDLTIRQEI